MCQPALQLLQKTTSHTCKKGKETLFCVFVIIVVLNKMIIEKVKKLPVRKKKRKERIEMPRVAGNCMNLNKMA